MDPISAAASIIALLEATGMTINLIRKLAASHKGARKEQEQAARRLFDLSSILGQILAFRNSLDNLGGTSVPNNERSNDKKATVETAKENSSLDHCMNEVCALRSLLEEMTQKNKFVWVLKEDKVQKRLEQIKIDVDTLHRIFQNSMLSSILQTTSRIDEIADGIQALELREKYQKMFGWLNAVSCSTNYLSARQKCQSRTGEWLLDSGAFILWKSKPQMMWLHGISGCGKTILCSTVLEHLRQEYGHVSNITIVYFFFDFQDIRKQHPDDFLRSMLEQLAAVDEDAAQTLQNLFRICSDGRVQPTRVQLLNACVEAASAFDKLFFIIDALDECRQSEFLNFGDILDALLQRVDRAHIIAFSQPLKEFQEIMRASSQQQLAIGGLNVDKDIEIYIHDRLESSRALRLFSSELLRRVEDKLIKTSGGMFRWVQLQIEELERCENGRELETQLETLPEGLPASYEKILSRLNEKQRRKAIHILICLSMSPQTLSVSEIESSLQLEPDAEVRIASDLKPNPGIVANMLLGLVSFTPWGGGDNDGNESDGEIRLAHSSVKDFLFSPAIRNGPLSVFAIDPAGGHHFMAKLCVACLLHYNKKNATREILQDTPFLPYAANNFSMHAIAANDWGERRTLDDLVVELFDTKSPALRNWHRICDPFTSRRTWDEKRSLSDEYTGLHHAVSWNLWRVAKKLIDAGADVNARLFMGAIQPIHFAAANGSFQCIDLLIEHGVDISSRAWGDKTPVHWISEVPYDRGEVATYLIDKGADMELKVNSLGTPLQQAAYHGRIRIAKALLEKGAKPNVAYGVDRIGTFRFGPALQFAAYSGHLGVVRLLIKHGAQINQVSTDIGTALHAAAINGKHQIVEALLDLGADISQKGGRFGSVMTAAYYGGSKPTVQIILKRLGIQEDDTTIQKRIVEVSEEKCWNLLEAARRNALGKIQHFVDNGSDINSRFWLSGETAILAAALQGHCEAVELLAKKGADLQSRDRMGRRAIHMAAQRGDQRMIEVLLVSGAEKDIRTDAYETAEDFAEEAGYPEVAGFLRTWKAPR